MNVSHEQDEPQRFDNLFWENLDRLEAQHQRVQTQHEHVRRDLESASRKASAELREVWDRYCAVIAELDRSTAEFEVLRTRVG